MRRGFGRAQAAAALAALATPSSTPSDYADMKKKVDTAESAAAAADRDATGDADR
ncbi:hypothetical protein AB0H51_21510 [Streptomyces griseoluteus]|uniref:hypothetical protein n=1 Tax=Streptomyces griseoluteus TaxID=29306 RepID=UPI0033EF2E79